MSEHTSLGYLDGLLDHAGGVMYVRDAAEGRFVLVNPAFEELIGLPASEIIGRTGHEIFPPDTADLHRANDLQVLTDGVARTSRERAPGADGTMRDYVSHKFVLYDPDGVAYAVGGISTDVTELESERQSFLDQRYDSEARFRAVFEHAPIGQVFSAIGGAVTEVNEALAGMLGYKPADMLGRQISDFADPAEMQRIRKAATRLLTGKRRTVTAIREFRHRSGEAVPVRVTSALLRDAAGEPRWWVSLVVDITEQERTRAELESAKRSAERAAEGLRVLHAIAGAANVAADIESAAVEVLRQTGGHFRWPAGVLLRWLPGGRRPVVAHWWIDPDATGIAGAELVPAAMTRAAAACAEPDDARVQILAPADQPGSGLAGRPALLLPIRTRAQRRYAWLFFAGDAPDEALDEESLELLGLIALETARLVERQEAQHQLLDTEQRFRSIFAGSSLPMALTIGSNGTWDEVNAALCSMLGYREADLIGRPAADFTHPEDRELLNPAGAAALASPDRRYGMELRLIDATGATVTTDVTLTWMVGRDGTLLLLSQMENITARRHAEASLRRQADEDSLTGLVNRSYLSGLLRQHAGQAEDFAVLFIDLDGFKIINDSRGHEVGDEVLIEVARRLEHAVRPDDVVARFGGDEFVALCRGPIDDTEAAAIARRIERSLAEVIHSRLGAVRVTASVGICCGTITAENPTELLQRADAAMYHAKRLGKDRSELYDARLHERALAGQRMESLLRTALDEDRFVLHFQPIVDLLKQRIVGFEALVRLLDVDGSIISPQEFIVVAERTGLVVPMGTWVLRQACATLAQLRDATGLPLTVSVNVAASQAARSDLSDTVSAALADAGLDERALCIELTESALLESNESTLAQLNELRGRGVQIALDDFGTGYSSLTYLRTFPVSTIKVDRSFVAGIGVRPGDLAIVRAVAGLARDLGIGCVAEGIETSRQLTEVMALGVAHGQGYLFAKPCPAAEALALLRAEAGQSLALGA